MSATNTTPNIGLPSFIGTDKPSWLTDWNGAMSTIDSEVGGLKTDLSGDETRIGNLENSVSSLNTTVANHTASITALNTQVSSQGGAINTITSLIGNGTPTTTDQTIIGAINEINAKLVEYDDITITADGTKTYKQLLEDLYALVLTTVVAKNRRYVCTCLFGNALINTYYNAQYGNNVHEVGNLPIFSFMAHAFSDAGSIIGYVGFGPGATDSYYRTLEDYYTGNRTVTNKNTDVPTSGQKITCEIIYL